MTRVKKRKTKPLKWHPAWVCPHCTRPLSRDQAIVIPGGYGSCRVKLYFCPHEQCGEMLLLIDPSHALAHRMPREYLKIQEHAGGWGMPVVPVVKMPDHTKREIHLKLDEARETMAQPDFQFVSIIPEQLSVQSMRNWLDQPKIKTLLGLPQFLKVEQ